MIPQTGFDNYILWGDVAVIAICVVILILLAASYVSRTSSLNIFLSIVGYIMIAALINIVYHGLLTERATGLYLAVYVLRLLYETLLFNVFFLFVLYVTQITGMAREQARLVAVVSCTLFFASVAADIILTVKGVGFRITEDGMVLNGINIFMIGYVLFTVLLVSLMRRVRDLLYKRVMYGFYGTMAVSLLVRFGQFVMNQSSLTTMTFVLPAIAMLYIMHSSPYNVTLGAVDVRAMEDMVRTMHRREQDFIFMSLLLPKYDEEGRVLPGEYQAVARKYAADYFRKGFLFQLSNGHVVLMAPKYCNPNYEELIQSILRDFDRQYKRYRQAFKVVVGESIEEISRKNEYASLIISVEHDMPDNTVRRVRQSDIDRFNREGYILRELADIYGKRDLEDPRVLAFCQPVFNIRTGRFDTAEALMRLNLEQTGLIFPDQFISLAEDHDYIHVLTEIILHKTCREIRKLTDEGFHISRISVNVSVLELKDESFCDDIEKIIARNQVPGEQVAIELTESRNEADFMVMKQKIDELRQEGIRFYLDDFGTGYSNMERIMELPFDIIKFDRSLVIASGASERSERIVENLAHLFRDMEYSVLYEGVEDEADEARCREMSASYLQGFKYSRPIPIEQLRDYASKAG